MTVQDVLALLSAVRKNGSGWMARCPAHDDRTPSLSVAEGDAGGVVLRCHGGCAAEKVCEALGIALADLAPPKVERVEVALHADRDADLIAAIHSILQRADGIRPLLPLSPEEALLVLDVDGVRGYCVRARPEGPACECEAFRHGHRCAHVFAALARWEAFYTARRRALDRDRADDAQRDAELDQLRRLAESNGNHAPFAVAS